MNKRNLILTGVSIAGIFVVAGATGWGTLKCHDIIQNRGLKTLDKVKKCAPYFAPAGIAILGTGAAIGANSYLGYKELAALSASAAYAVKNRKFLGEKIQEKFPEEAKLIKRKLYEEHMKSPGLETVELTGNGDVMCLEGFSGRWFRSSPEAVEKAIDQLNDLLRENEYASLNDLYRFLGITETHFGWQYGWVANPDFFPVYDGVPIVQYDNTMIYDEQRKEDVYVMDLEVYPMECWMEV